jgi:transcriptional regulator with XRE-family HTH domain
MQALSRTGTRFSSRSAPRLMVGCGMASSGQPRERQIHLRAWREHAGLSQEELGRRLGVRHSAISRWENGRRPVTLDQLFSIAKEVTPRGLVADLFDVPGESVSEEAEHIRDLLVAQHAHLDAVSEWMVSRGLPGVPPSEEVGRVGDLWGKAEMSPQSRQIVEEVGRLLQLWTELSSQKRQVLLEIARLIRGL